MGFREGNPWAAGPAFMSFEEKGPRDRALRNKREKR